MRDLVNPIDLARQPQHGLARGFRSGMLGRLRKKTLKIVERGLEAFEALVQRAALHQLFQRTRVEQQNAIERRQRARRIAILEIDQFQIAENANQDVPDPDWLKVRRRHLDRLSIDLGQARANFLQRQDGAFGERVDNELAAFVDRLDQKMGRETDPVEIEAEPFADFQIKHGERNRDAAAAVNHFIQKRVARVGILLAIALEALLLEQKMRQELNLLDGVVAHFDHHLGLARQRRDLIEILVEFERRIFFLRDKQRTTRQGD